MKRAKLNLKREKVLGRYAAKLLFQFLVTIDGIASARRICEERVINYPAASAQGALREAKRRGRLAQYHYKNNDGNPVWFQFIGVLELLRLDPACEPDEVWFEIVERVRPMERRTSILTPERKLSAIRNFE